MDSTNINSGQVCEHGVPFACDCKRCDAVEIMDRVKEVTLTRRSPEDREAYYAQIAAHNALLRRQRDELAEGARGILKALDDGLLVRDTRGDSDSAWAIKFMPVVLAISRTAKALDAIKAASPSPALDSCVPKGATGTEKLRDHGDERTPGRSPYAIQQLRTGASEWDGAPLDAHEKLAIDSGAGQAICRREGYLRAIEDLKRMGHFPVALTLENICPFTVPPPSCAKHGPMVHDDGEFFCVECDSGAGHTSGPAPERPLIVSNYTDEDDKCGILDNANNIIVVVSKLHHRPALQALCAAYNAYRDGPIPLPEDESLIAERLNLDANGVDQ